MQKTVGFLIVITLIITLTFSLSGCVSESEKFIGSWKTEMDLSSDINKTLQSTLEDEVVGKYFVCHEYVLDFVLEFREDGTYSAYFTPKSIESAQKALEEDLKRGAESYIRDTVKSAIKSNNLNVTVDEYFENQKKQTVAEAADELLRESGLKEFIESMGETEKTMGNYLVEEGKLYTTDSTGEKIDRNEYETYEITTKKLTLLKAYGGSNTEGDAYPVVFDRVEK